MPDTLAAMSCGADLVLPFAGLRQERVLVDGGQLTLTQETLARHPHIRHLISSGRVHL
eukprot:COSAG01_NODE_8457_length_2780_cov_3.509138_2_plen_58_part_00